MFRCLCVANTNVLFVLVVCGCLVGSCGFVTL